MAITDVTVVNSPIEPNCSSHESNLILPVPKHILLSIHPHFFFERHSYGYIINKIAYYETRGSSTHIHESFPTFACLSRSWANRLASLSQFSIKIYANPFHRVRVPFITYCCRWCCREKPPYCTMPHPSYLFAQCHPMGWSSSNPSLKVYASALLKKKVYASAVWESDTCKQQQYILDWLQYYLGILGPREKKSKPSKLPEESTVRICTEASSISFIYIILFLVEHTHPRVSSSNWIPPVGEKSFPT